MFSEVTLAPEIEDFLRGLSVPVRVLNGNAARRNPPSSWRGHVQASGYSSNECVSDGLTLVSWGSDHDAALTYVAYLSGDVYSHGHRRAVSREFVGDVRRDERSYMPQVAGRDSATLARMDADRRIVWFGFPLSSYADGGLDLADVDLYKIIGEPVMRVLGAERLPRATDRARTMFLENADRSHNGTITRLERQIADQRASIANYAECIRNGYGSIRQSESELAVQRRVTTVCQARLRERWDALVAHPKLTRIGHDGSKLVLTTVPLDIENPNSGKTRYLGIIDIKLQHGGYGLTLTLANVDNAGGPGDDEGGWAHPHCPQNGVPCWGGTEGLAGDLLASHDLPAILEFTLQYLESYNPGDSWGESHAPMWGFGEHEYVEGDEDEDEDECMCSDCVAAREAA